MPFAASRRHEYWTVDIRYINNDLVGGQGGYAAGQELPPGEGTRMIADPL